MAKENSLDLLRKLVGGELEEVNQIIVDLAQSHASLIPQITEHLISSGGKRLRPILTLACGKLIKCTNRNPIYLATAVEFIHTATLFHDDVIDESSLRRGKKTANSIWGNKAAILVGDFLLSQAFKLMVKTNSIKALDMLSAASVIITEAETWQLELTGRCDLTLDDYVKLITGKTASLFAAACASSAVAFMSAPEVIDALYKYGLNLGIVFQMIDDILDYTAKNLEFGKQIGSDLLERKITLPIIVLLKNANSEDKNRIIKIIKAKKPNLKTIEKMLSKYNVLHECYMICEKYSLNAKNALKTFPESFEKNHLVDLVDVLTKRIY